MKSDGELMLELQDGRSEAFDELVERHQVPLFNFFLRLSNNRALAEDFTQEVFVKLYTHAGTYVRTAKFTTYMYRIARNTWVDHIRKLKRRGTMDSLDRETEQGSPLVDQIAADPDDPHDRMEQADQGAIVRDAIESLPEEQRMVFILSEVQGMKYAEIAAAMEIPLGTVKSRMHTAVQKLRELLERRGISGAE